MLQRVLPTTGLHHVHEPAASKAFRRARFYMNTMLSTGTPASIFSTRKIWRQNPHHWSAAHQRQQNCRALSLASARRDRSRAYHRRTRQQPSFVSPNLPALASSRSPCLLHLRWRHESAAHTPSKQQEIAHIFESNNIPTQPRPSVSPDSHLDVRLQTATGSASITLASPACRMDSASALRSPSSRCCRIAHCFQLVSHTDSSTVFSGLRKASRSRLGSKQNLPTSIELYRLATAGPVVSAPRTSPRRSASGLPVHLSRAQ